MENEQSEFDFNQEVSTNCDGMTIIDTTSASSIYTSSPSTVTTSSITDSSITLSPYLSSSSAAIPEIYETMTEVQDKLKTIEKRLGILVPDEKLLEQYELLQSLYNQYTAAEALLYDGEEEDE